MAIGHPNNDWIILRGTLECVNPTHYVKEGENYRDVILVNPSERFATKIVIVGKDNHTYTGIIWDVVADNYVGKPVELREKPVTFDFNVPGVESFFAVRPITLVQRLYCEGSLIFESMVELIKVK